LTPIRANHPPPNAATGTCREDTRLVLKHGAASLFGFTTPPGG
jgi:hypothetical protein